MAYSNYMRLLLKCKTKCNHVHYIHALKLRYLALDAIIDQNTPMLGQIIAHNASTDEKRRRGRTKKQSKGRKGKRL